MQWLARKLVAVRIRQRSRFGERPPKRIVNVSGGGMLIRVDEHRHVAVAVGMEIRMWGLDIGHFRARQQPANTTCAFQTATQILPARERDHRRVILVALLENHVAVVNETRLRGLHPGAVAPFIIPLDPPAHLAVIDKFRFPFVAHHDAGQLILVVVGEDPFAVVGQVAILVVGVNRVRWQIDRDAVGVESTQTVLCDGSEGVTAIHRSEAALGECAVAVERGAAAVDGDAGGGHGGGPGHGQGIGHVACHIRDLIQAVHVEILDQRVVGAIIQISRRIVGITELFMQAAG